MKTAEEIEESCYRVGYSAAIAHNGKHVEPIVNARSLMFKYPDEYLEGYHDAMSDHEIYFPEDMSRPITTGDVLVDMLADNC